MRGSRLRNAGVRLCAVSLKVVPVWADMPFHLVHRAVAVAAAAGVQRASPGHAGPLAQLPGSRESVSGNVKRAAGVGAWSMLPRSLLTT